MYHLVFSKQANSYTVLFYLFSFNVSFNLLAKRLLFVAVLSSFHWHGRVYHTGVFVTSLTSRLPTL